MYEHWAAISLDSFNQACAVRSGGSIAIFCLSVRLSQSGEAWERVDGMAAGCMGWS